MTPSPLYLAETESGPVLRALCRVAAGEDDALFRAVLDVAVLGLPQRQVCRDSGLARATVQRKSRWVLDQVRLLQIKGMGEGVVRS